MAEILNQEEIDRLLSAISAGESAAVETAPPDRRRRIKIYDFKRPDKFSKDQMRTISNVHEIFARLTSTALSAHIRSLSSVRLASVDQLTYEEFIRSIPNPTTLAVVDMEPLKGSAMLEVDPAVAFAILDRLFGGRGDGGKLTRELTDIERSAIEGIFVRMLGSLRESWSTVMELRPRLGPIETNPQFAQIVPNSEMVVLVTLETRIGEVEGLMNVCMPCLTLKAVSSRLSERYLYSPVRKGSTSENAAALRGRLEGIEIPVVAKIGSLEVKMREVLSLRAGDVIRIPDSRASGPLTVTIGDRVKFTCRPGVVGKRAAVQILGKIEGVRPEEMADAAELNAG